MMYQEAKGFWVDPRTSILTPENLPFKTFLEQAEAYSKRGTKDSERYEVFSRILMLCCPHCFKREKRDIAQKNFEKMCDYVRQNQTDERMLPEFRTCVGNREREAIKEFRLENISNLGLETGECHFRALSTSGNYKRYLKSEKKFDDIIFNTLSQQVERGNGELVSNSIKKEIVDECEDRFGMKINLQNLSIAIDTLSRTERSTNPVTNLIKATKYQGGDWASQFLTLYLGARDNEYTREVSRLIFLGATKRALFPGCKFDFVPIFIGKQGCGKSTAIRILAMDDRFALSLDTLDGDNAVEKMRGKWICEIPELLAMQKSRASVEQIKSFITTQTDRVRFKYEPDAVDIKRSQIFIGTTNNYTPLTDKSGNRRFLPVEIDPRANGFFLDAIHESACQAIKQAYAQMYYYLTLHPTGEEEFETKRKMTSPVLSKEAQKIAKVEQENAMEIDPDEDKIKEYVKANPNKSYFCTQDIWENALGQDGKPQIKESRYINLILSNIDELRKSDGPVFIEGYGKVRVFERHNV